MRTGKPRKKLVLSHETLKLVTGGDDLVPQMIYKSAIKQLCGGSNAYGQCSGLPPFCR